MQAMMTTFTNKTGAVIRFEIGNLPGDPCDIYECEPGGYMTGPVNYIKAFKRQGLIQASQPGQLAPQMHEPARPRMPNRAHFVELIGEENVRKLEEDADSFSAGPEPDEFAAGPEPDEFAEELAGAVEQLEMPAESPLTGDVDSADPPGTDPQPTPEPKKGKGRKRGG